MRTLCLLAALTGCGRWGFGDARLSSADAGSDDAGAADATDASIDPPACTSFGEWTTPVNLGAVNGNQDDWSPTISDDGLELIFESSRSGSGDLYRAVRAATADPFGAPVALTVLNGAQSEAAPSLTLDRLGLYFTSERTGASRLYRATRADKDAVFDAPDLVAELAGTEMLGPAIAASGDELFFTDITQSQISRAVATAGVFTVDGVVTELGTASSAYPDLSRDGRTLYFDINDNTLVSATRAAPGSAFSTPGPVPVIDSAADEADADLGHRDRAIVFASARAGGAGGFDLWMSTRPCN